MGVDHAAVLLLLLTAGCARVEHDTGGPEPQTVATPPGTPQPAAKPAVPPLDLKAMTEELKATRALGVFTKIALKNQIDDLLDRFDQFYQGTATLPMRDLRRSYDLLMMKVLSLLQDEDQKLASAIVSSREAIWGLLADPKKFGTLRG
jgi:hypothetical protein